MICSLNILQISKSIDYNLNMAPLSLKMLCLYLLGQKCLHLTFKTYLSSKTYSRKYEKLPNIVIYACKIITE